MKSVEESMKRAIILGSITRDGAVGIVALPGATPGVSLRTRGSRYDRLNGYINPATFTASPAYTVGNAPRTLFFPGPDYEK
jgi:hypothetical protein